MTFDNSQDFDLRRPMSHLGLEPGNYRTEAMKNVEKQLGRNYPDKLHDWIMVDTEEQISRLEGVSEYVWAQSGYKPHQALTLIATIEESKRKSLFKYLAKEIRLGDTLSGISIISEHPDITYADKSYMLGIINEQ